jgi:nucleoside-diphosphate-sugar epimerase
MKILITGGSGFLGSHVARALLARGDQVSLLGRNFDAVPDLVTAGATPVRADLRDKQTVVAACAGMDAVVHAGALSSPWGHPTAFRDVNAGGTLSVVEGCQQHGVGRLVHLSSPAVVFDGRDHENLTEAAPYPINYSSEYAASKKTAEDMVNVAAKQGLPAVILRPKAIFGPGDRALLPRLTAAARQGKLRQFGDGKNLVDLTYVDNVVQAILLALSAPAAVGHTYFITNGEHVPLWLTIRRTLDALAIPSDLRPLALPLAMLVARFMEAGASMSGAEPLLTRYTVGVLARTQTYDISAARRDLGYQPQVSFNEGMGRTLEALKK